jgi:hypothetical protein
MSFKTIILLLCLGIYGSLYGNTAMEATNQISRITQIQIENDYSPSCYYAHGTTNTFYLRPIFRITPNRWIPVTQFIRIKALPVTTLPYSTDSTPVTLASTSTGDTQFLDLFLFHDDQVYRAGVGFIAIIPTATVVQAGQGKWQAGPAFGFSYTGIPHWQFSILAQNPISFAGISRLPFQNTLLFKPSIVFNVTEEWYLISEAEWTLDWSQNQYQIPVNIGIGKIITFAKKKYNLCVEAEWMAYQHTNQVIPKFTVQVTLAFLYE